MTTTQLAEKLNLNKLTGGSEKEISSCYISDLLSQVMGSCKAGDVWITVQASINTVAVAQMIDVSCVIIAEGVPMAENVLEKANNEDVVVFSSEENAYSLACKISKIL